MCTEFSHGVSLELPWTAHLPTQAGSLVLAFAQGLLLAMSSRWGLASDRNMSSLGTPRGSPLFLLAAVSQDGVSLSAQVLPTPCAGCLLSRAVIRHAAESSAGTHPCSPPSSL